MEFQYRGLKGTLEHVEVTEKELDARLMQLQQQHPCVKTVTDRAAKAGDELVLDYAGYADGVQFPGGTAENQTLTLGSGAFIPGFEDQLVGSRPGDEVRVHVTFPAQYHAPELAGKDAEFVCKVHEIRESGEYGSQDEFAKAVGCGSYEDLRAQVRENLRRYYDQRAEMELQDKLMRQAAATLDYTPSEAELHEAVEQQIQTMEAQLAQRGLRLEDYCKFAGPHRSRCGRMPAPTPSSPCGCRRPSTESPSWKGCARRRRIWTTRCRSSRGRTASRSISSRATVTTTSTAPWKTASSPQRHTRSCARWPTSPRSPSAAKNKY